MRLITTRRNSIFSLRLRNSMILSIPPSYWGISTLYVIIDSMAMMALSQARPRVTVMLSFVHFFPSLTVFTLGDLPILTYDP